MNPFDYALGLLTILMGLALADVALSFHRLAVRMHSVRWDGRPLAAAALVVMEMVRLWFAQWTLRNMPVALTFPVYLLLFVHMLVLVLIAAACLPDDPGEDCDLGAFYEQRRRYFWSLFVLYETMFFINWLIFGATNASGNAPAGALDWFRVVAPIFAFALPIFIRRRWLDYAVPLGFILFYAVRYWHATLAVAA